MNQPRRYLTRESARELDRRAFEEYGIPGIVLMENAGRGVADMVEDLVRDSGAGDKAVDAPRVVICCGKGNNGGDGFVVARHLELQGIATRTFLWATPGELSADAATNYWIAVHSGLDVQVCDIDTAFDQFHTACDGAVCVVDALFGTGARGNPRAPYDDVIRAINRQAAPVVSVDVPSGLDCNTGRAGSPTVRAVVTCTFVAEKQGFATAEARSVTGDVRIVQIGTPKKLLEEVLAAAD
jgi:NAD(P)H-hydrate epimerase